MEAHVSPWSREASEAAVDLVVVAEPRGRPRPVRVRTLPGDRMRRGARTLRWLALLLAVLVMAGALLTTYADGSEPGFDPYGSGWARFGQFLSGISWGLGIAALVLASSFVVAAQAARLDLDQSLPAD